MSENLDLVRSIYAAWERGDFTSSSWADPEIEYAVIDGPTPGGGRGLASMSEAMADYARPWQGYRVQVDQYRTLDDERVLVLLRQHGRGKASGTDLTAIHTDAANVLHVRDGKVIKLVVYWERARAIADLGIADG
jgi:ketosteroid isomerase-like protein